MKRIFAWLLMAALLLCGCSKEPEVDYSQKFDSAPDITETVGGALDVEQTRPVAEDGQLYAVIASQEEAEAIAEQYGITLVRCGAHVAVFYTEEDPEAVIQRGLDNGWPELSLNDVLSVD